MSNHVAWLRRKGARVAVGVAALVTILAPAIPAHAAGTNDTDFNIQVSPSPLAVTLTPGKTASVALTLRNFSAHSETLKAQLSGFKIDASSQKINLDQPVPAGMQEWVTFKQSQLTIAPGGTQQLDVVFNTPTTVGFSYSLAIILSRAAGGPAIAPGATLKAAVAVFCLVNINRPDAQSGLAIQSFTSKKSQYDFLPASFTLRIANTGNIINQPSGNIFIQRSFDDTKPLAVIPLNPGAGYILPNTSRLFTMAWQSGFPADVSRTANGKTSLHLSWNWKRINDFRVGHYVAKAVLVYNNGHQDVPVIASTSFWVIPWWLLIGGILFGIVLMMGLIAWGWLIFKGTTKVRGYAARHKKQ